ncbi:ABC transporter substrate-binding protein [Paenibacillus urinalis]|uniref:ABC transporter substrate-binding protein n=1 Tax=Paenibacillus urinalis TaxID=521520 RepID=UPI0019621D46
MKKWSVKLAALALAMSIIAACGNEGAGSGEETSTQAQQETSQTGGAETQATENESADTEATESTAAEDNTGAAIEVDEELVESILAQFNGETPESTVTLSVAIAELYNELGLELAGVPTTQSELPEAYQEVQQVGTSHQPDLEVIASLSPDTVLAPESIKDSISKMFEPSGLPAAYLPVNSLDELKASIVALGRLHGKETEAQEVLTSFAEQEEKVLSSAEGKESPSVMFLFGSTEYLMLMNEDTFPGSLANNLGATNVLKDTIQSNETYVPFNMESVVETDPDVILLVAHGDVEAVTKKFEEDLKKNAAWDKLTAAKSGKIQALDYNLFGTASLSKAPEAYEALSSILFEE